MAVELLWRVQSHVARLTQPLTALRALHAGRGRVAQLAGRRRRGGGGHRSGREDGGGVQRRAAGQGVEKGERSGAAGEWRWQAEVVTGQAEAELS